MTLEEFRATRAVTPWAEIDRAYWVDPIQAYEDVKTPEAIVTYCNDGAWIAHLGGDAYELHLERSDTRGTLATLEEILFAWATDEGLTE